MKLLGHFHAHVNKVLRRACPGLTRMTFVLHDDGVWEAEITSSTHGRIFADGATPINAALAAFRMARRVEVPADVKPTEWVTMQPDSHAQSRMRAVEAGQRTLEVLNAFVIRPNPNAMRS